MYNFNDENVTLNGATLSSGFNLIGLKINFINYNRSKYLLKYFEYIIRRLMQQSAQFGIQHYTKLKEQCVKENLATSCRLRVLISSTIIIT